MRRFCQRKLSPKRSPRRRKAATWPWLGDEKALRLLGDARPDANVPMAEKREIVASALNEWPALEAALVGPIKQRAAALEQSYRRVRQTVGLARRDRSRSSRSFRPTCSGCSFCSRFSEHGSAVSDPDRGRPAGA